METPETNRSQNQAEKSAEQTKLTNKKILAFSLEFGFMIALPLVIFAFAGKWLSDYYGNLAFFYGGIILALLTSFAWFWKRINDIYNDFIN